MKIKQLLIVFLTGMVLLSGCDQSDDVAGIFIGKTWKLTNIYMDDKSSPPRPSLDYWNNEESRKESERLLMEKGTFLLRFDGLVIDDIITGTYSGRATNVNISGKWEADGKNRKFSTDQQPVADNDPLGRAFIRALQNGYKYAGDYNQLQIFFEEDNKKKFMLFRVEDE